jgi:hypothetical protein
VKRLLFLLPWLWLLATAASAEIRIERLDARLDGVIAPDVTAETLATG